jgi:hypothetical protein
MAVPVECFKYFIILVITGDNNTLMLYYINRDYQLFLCPKDTAKYPNLDTIARNDMLHLNETFCAR